MITFRQATRDDFPALSRILTLASCHGDALWSDLNRHISGWVACAEGRPVGLALADRNDGKLLVVGVEQEVSGRGIGRELMKQAEAWLFSHGWSEISLTLPEGSDTDSCGFFQHLGWNISQPDGDCQHLKKTNSRSCIKLEEHLIDDPDTGYSRLVRLQRGPADKNHRLCLFLDGEHYWRDMDVIPLLNRLLERGNLPPMTIALRLIYLVRVHALPPVLRKKSSSHQGTKAPRMTENEIGKIVEDKSIPLDRAPGLGLPEIVDEVTLARRLETKGLLERSMDNSVNRVVPL
tara:strand:- start:2376 stop:3248 length:873 start_codon:yes stop_codon:yes gene_type:complete